MSKEERLAYELLRINQTLKPSWPCAIKGQDKPVEWRESAVESHIRQYPISTMADIVERLRREIEVSGGLTTIRRDQLKRVQRNLSQLVAQIDGKGPR